MSSNRAFFIRKQSWSMIKDQLLGGYWSTARGIKCPSYRRLAHDLWAMRRAKIDLR